MPIRFPDPKEASEDGIVAVGGHLDPLTLEEAYTHGIFPWPIEEDYPLTWFSPDPRGIIDLNEIHLSRSFKRFLHSHTLEVKFNQDFEEIIRACANVKRKNQSGTWIFEGIVRGYHALFKANKAYSVGVYQGDVLVAGVYGVCFGELISGESMFHKHPNASKLALYHLLIQLQQREIPFLDTQMVTPVVESFGGKYIARELFLEKIKRLDTRRSRIDIFGS